MYLTWYHVWFSQKLVDYRIEHFAISTVDQDDSHVNVTCYASKSGHVVSWQGQVWTWDICSRNWHIPQKSGWVATLISVQPHRSPYSLFLLCLAGQPMWSSLWISVCFTFLWYQVQLLGFFCQPYDSQLQSCYFWLVFSHTPSFSVDPPLTLTIHNSLFSFSSDLNPTVYATLLIKRCFH